HIDPDVQQALADLVDELIRVMDPHAPALEAAHLAESSTHLVQALHRKQHAGLLTAATERLEAAATRAEAEARSPPDLPAGPAARRPPGQPGDLTRRDAMPPDRPSVI